MLLRTLLLTSLACLLAAPARATWTESGNVTIRIVGELGGLEFVEANQIGLDADLYDVFVGSASEVGTLTVAEQSGGDEPTDLGGWVVYNGTGNVQGVRGDGSFNVGSGTQEDDLDGVLEFLGSDVTGGIGVRKGNLRVRAASNVGNIHVFPLGRADVVEGSVSGYIQTDAGSLALMDGSISDSGLNCKWVGTLRAEESIIRCGSVDVELGGVTEIGLHSFSTSELEVAGNLEVRDADLAVVNTNVSTGSLDMRGGDSSLDVAGGTWTNAGILDFHPSAVVGPVTIDIHGGAQFHTMGLARVSGHPAYEQLKVRGDGTLLEVDGDLRIGEYVVSGPVQHFTGNVTVEDGATIVVHGTLKVDTQAVLNLSEGGTIYANDIDDDGTINENGGQLILPEPGATADALASIAVVALVRRGRRSC